MRIHDSMRALEQEIYVACSEGNYSTVNMLENQLEQLRDRMEHPLDDDIFSLEGRPFLENKEW